jgi:hypothetical protein
LAWLVIGLFDKSIAEAPGTKLSYFGYEFEVPWSDLDETQTKLYPKEKSEKNRVDLRFRSGLRLFVTAVPAKSWAKEWAATLKVPESSFVESDYSFERRLYEFTPDKMNKWALSPQVHFREQYLLIIKSVGLSRFAETGIFNLQNQSYRGFQLGNPQVRQDGIIVHMFSDEGSVEMIFSQKHYRSPAGVTQPEINRIVWSLHKAGAADLRIAKGDN